jgi:SAM-dependent methyltransferase
MSRSLPAGGFVALSETGVRLLIRARLSGVRFERTLVVGRQALAVSPLRVWRLLKAAQLVDAGAADWLTELGEWPSYAEPLFRALGARDLMSMDNSDYEQADMIHDLNRPIGEELENSFDVVLDGGSLEHVFDFLQALRNVMRMARPGGHVILLVAANDMCGHGFYQFSPELFFRALSPENGFSVEEMIMLENDTVSRRLFGLVPYTVELTGRAFKVHDPSVVGQRIEITSRGSTILFVVARKIASTGLFMVAPQQSDYSSLWEDRGDSGPRAPGRAGAIRPDDRPRRLLLSSALHVSYSVLPRAIGPLRRVVEARHRRGKRFTSGHPGLEPLDLRRFPPPTDRVSVPDRVH